MHTNVEPIFVYNKME